jgi:bifunctional DNA-binding transcriptional regulator/antitoxin component of YhaV-PrlF toxin-antitoxin module
VAALARLQTRGQFTVPESVRRATGVQPGDTLLVRAVEPGRFEVIVLPHVSAEEFFEAMALRDDLTAADLRRAVAEGVEARVSPDTGGSTGLALAEVAAAREREEPN